MSADTARHEWIDTWCTRLQAIMHTPDTDQPADGSRLVALPAWLWLAPAIDLGRKAVRADGRAMLMPVRLTWTGDDQHLLSLPAGTHELAWTALGMGHSATGTLTVTVTATGITHDAAHPDLAPTDAGADTTAARAALAAAAAEGRWAARMSLEGYVERAVKAAVATVTRDIHGLRAPAAVIDWHSEEQIRDTMLLGTDKAAGAVDRIIDRSLARTAFVKVDPLRYLTVDLQRAAEAYVRRAISDPPIGRKVRRVARSMPGASMAEIIAAYRQAHPGDFLSEKRAARALTAGSDINASAWHLSWYRGEHHIRDVDAIDVEDVAVANVDAQAHLATVRTLATRSRDALRAELTDLREAS
ncbi:hypothetical protein [Cellulosimicrobium sp. Marseille-Q4280]|uniref:hypothetical protein n=1 Tax=Cellulosimicrobium sp. Marseille-Q4280 TaxID=2937992 RepID=UPI00203D0E02|nr:hypothetical protein [Cellulosimicrobium sp. Marseille-Q4280]